MKIPANISASHLAASPELYPQCTRLLVTQHHAKVFIKSRSSPFPEVNHLLLWWSSSKAMAEDVMCQSDSGRARFNTITFMESMWNDSSYKTETIENFKWIVYIYNNTLSMEVHRERHSLYKNLHELFQMKGDKSLEIIVHRPVDLVMFKSCVDIL